jgi:tRNA/rRNA methyltransferase
MAWCKNLRVVVIEPSAAGNVGWIARGMANFGAEELVLVNPASFDRALAKDFACHGAFIIDAMRSVSSLEEALEGVSFAAGTTRRAGRNEYSCGAKEAAPVIADRLSSGRAAIVFGRESSGLTKEEKARCSLLASIETAEGPRGSLNISHAAALFLYEISCSLRENPGREGSDFSGAEEAFDKALESMPGYRKNGIYQKAMHAVLSRALPSAEEASRLSDAFRLLRRRKDEVK